VSLKDEVEALAIAGAPKCTLAVLRENHPDVADEIDECFAAGLSYAGIEMALKNRGYGPDRLVGRATLSRHSRGFCRCRV
jgi:hypothetical protein